MVTCESCQGLITLRPRTRLTSVQVDLQHLPTSSVLVAGAELGIGLGLVRA